jgi:SAM-dependent methyltransferase
MDEYLNANQSRWDELVPIHAASSFYDLDAFRAGRSSLSPVVRGEVGDVTGRSLLHLQCHFGLDTISWARLGARAVGIDFSQPAIELARALAAELKVDAEFVCCDVYESPSTLQRQFEIVFTSYGVLTWLPDLDRWADTVARCLLPGGRFHLIELHPFACMFDDETAEFRLRYPYFRGTEPIRIDRPGSYASPAAILDNQVTYSWPAGVAEVISALLAAGLHLETLHEYPHSPERLRPGLIQDDDGFWRTPPELPDLPLVFAVRVSKPR